MGCAWISLMHEFLTLVLKKGRVADMFWFSISETPFLTISKKPLRSRIAASVLKDSNKMSHPGKVKALIYQHGILPRILRPLLSYELLEGPSRSWAGNPRNPPVEEQQE